MEDIQQFRLILSQLRYLPHIKDPENFTSKLLDVIEIAPFPAQLEILDSIPAILPDSEYNETATKLGDLLERHDELSNAIIDCLNTLNIDPEIRVEIQDHILTKILPGISLNVFPVMLDFLLSEASVKNLPVLLLKIRVALDSVMTENDNDSEKQSAKILIFNKLQSTASSKNIVDAWIGVISSFKKHTEHKPIDFLILFMLHSCGKLKKRPIELLFRKRIKDGLFKITHIEQLFEKYFPQQLLRNYFNSILEIISSLLRTTADPTVTEFTATLAKTLFRNRFMDSTSKQEILESLLLLVGFSDQKNTAIILKIFSDLSGNISKTPRNVEILMRLLNKLETFELKDVKVVFDILCQLTCSEDSLSGLKEELHMIVRKQLSGFIKTRGIIAGIIMAKHIAKIKDDQNSLTLSDDSIVSISQLKGVAKEAATILQMAQTSTGGNSQLTGLFYDELSDLICKTEDLHKNFQTWLYETITNDFQRTFVTETVSQEVRGLKLAAQYNLNTEDEVETPLSINVAELTLKSNSITVLAPHFRLLRLLHFRENNGDLSMIDALLGCGVVLPKTEDRENLNGDQLKHVADSIYHCINWFREIISAFLLQKSRKLRGKVLQRLDNLIELENLLIEISDEMLDYKPPAIYMEKIISPLKESKQRQQQKQPKKKMKSKELVEDTTIQAIASTSKIKRSTESRAQIKFREIDIDIVKLLRYPIDQHDNEISSDQNRLNIAQLNFILQDFCQKLNALTNNQDLGLSPLNIVTPEYLMADCVYILINLNKHFLYITAILKDDSCENKEEHQKCFGLILESVSLIYAWPGLQNCKRLDLIRDILKTFRWQRAELPDLHSIKNLVGELMDRVIACTEECLTLEHGVHLIKIMESLNSLSMHSTHNSKISTAAHKLLCKSWDTRSAVNINKLMKTYLSETTLKSLCHEVETLQSEAHLLSKKNDYLPMMKSIDKSNFYILYHNIWTFLHERIKIDIPSLNHTQHLTLWKTAVVTMQRLMTIVKAQETKSNLVCFLKKCIAILKLFITHGIPILEIELRSKPDEVVDIFKTLQLNTRFLHHLCCYSKLMKDAGIVAYVPQFRLTLETLVYRVKAALVANNCSDAFWMGNLRNRDMQGEDILSQSTTTTSVVEDGEAEEELVVTDDELSEEEGRSGKRSGSEVFD